MRFPDNLLTPARYSHLALWRPALRVLCYHRVHPLSSDRFSVTPDQFDLQLRYFIHSGFNLICARDLLCERPLPERPLLLTFDDGYVDNLQFAQPILQRHGARATIFIVSAYAGDRARWVADGSALMSPQQLRELNPDLIELALHSHSHRAFASLSLDEIEDDLRRNLGFFSEHSLSVTPVLAYPYGSRPRCSPGQLQTVLTRLGISLAFRIGNRLNRLPLANPYEIQRIDVRSDASEAAFRWKLWVGKLP
jgi:peptidoglycan/xylan/chitin deacetylase (PgdA/CDA1 family)